MMKNFVSVISNPAVFSPTIYLAPEIIKDEDGHVVIHVHVPPSAEVHSYKKIIYDRVDDADVKVTSTSQIASMYIRKQNIFTEKKIFPYVAMEDLRLDLLPRIRQMAGNHAGGSHPWENMNDEELLKSAGLYVMHREFTSSYTAKFVIERNRMYVENANRASKEGIITPDNLEPNPKNPIIASFFRTIGRADWLGSGVRNLFKYSKYYSGLEPEFIEGDVFRIIVPLDDEYSFDYAQDKVKYDVRNGIKDAKIVYDFMADTGKVREKYGKN